MVPTADPNLPAGTRTDVGFGLHLYGAGSLLSGHRARMEVLVLIAQDLDGPQPETDWSVVIGWQESFAPQQGKRMRMKTRTLVACAVVLLASTAVWAQAGPAETGRAEATRIFRMLMSPFCPGLTLADCPSTNAFTLRDEIRDRLVQGESADAVVSDLVNRYGTTILADPSGTPTGRMLVGIPLSLSSLGGLAVILYVRRRLRSSEPEVSSVAATDWKLQQRLDDELDELD